MTVGDVLDGAFDLLRADLRAVVVVAGLLIAPVQVVVAWTQRELLGSFGVLELAEDPTAAELALQGELGAGLAPWIVSAVAALTVLPLAAGGVAAVVGGRALGRPVAPGEALAAAVRRLPALVGAIVVAWAVKLVPLAPAALLLVAGVLAGPAAAAVLGLGAVALGLVLAPLSVVAMALTMLTVPAVMLEGRGPVAAVRRSMELVRRRLGPALVVALLTAVVTGLVRGVVAGLPNLAGMGGGEIGWVVAGVGTAVAEMLAASAVTAVAVLFMLDARMRLEGLDLLLDAERLEDDAARRSARA